MLRPWLLAALFAGLIVPFASAQATNEVAARFLKAEGITYNSRIGELLVFRMLVDADKKNFDATIGRVTPQQEFDGLVARARALDALNGPDARRAEPAPKAQAPAPAAVAASGAAGRIAKAAQSQDFDGSGAMDLDVSIRLQGGASRSDEGTTSPAAGGMIRLGVGSPKFGTVGPQGGVIWSGNGYSNVRIGHELIDYNRSYRYGEWELWEDTYRRVSGLNKFRFGGVSYKSPYIGGRVALEAGIDLSLASMNTRPELIRESYLREWIDVPCRDSQGYTIPGDCSRVDTRTLDRRTLAQGPGVKQSGWGNTKYIAAEIANRRQTVAVRVEASKDSFKAFPEASSWGVQGGVTFNLGK